MKRILGALISSVMLAVTCLTALPVSAKEEYTEYIVPFYSDQTKQRQVLGISNKSLLKDGVVLIPLETACEIAGASIAAENDEAVVINRNYVSWCCEYTDEAHQYLFIDEKTGKGNYYESILRQTPESPNRNNGPFSFFSDFYRLQKSFFYQPDKKPQTTFDNPITLFVSEVYRTSVKYEYYNNELYVSFYEFLVMMGVDVELINHEAINEITAFYTSMTEEYSDDEDYKTVASKIDKLFSAGTGYEQFFYCYLGTPIDELYKAYYDSDLMCDLGDYYGDRSVEWANLVNAVENYDGFTKTALAALNLNTDYEDVLINTVTYHRDSEDDNFSKTVNDSVDIIQRLLYVRDFGLSVEEIYRDDSVLETVWRMQEKADNIEPILSSVDNLDVDFSLSPDVISMVYSGLCGAMKNYAKYREISNLFEGEQHLIKNTILSSDAMASNATDEARGMFISHILNPMGNVIEMHSNLRNEENSYFNLYHSAAKVQETMNASSPAAWAAVWGAISDAALSTSDDLIMGVIDYTFFGTMPVSSLVNSGILFCVDGLKNSAYGKEQSQIAELDDYVFIQEVAKDCFKEHSLTSENAYSSFLLGLKATMLAYETNDQDSSWDPNYKDSDSVKAYKEMNKMLNISLSNSVNTDIYYINPGDCGDLTEMLGGNTDISKLDTTPRQDITLEFGEETNEPTKSETIDYEKIYYSYIENELIPQYGLSDLAGFEAVNWNNSPAVNEIPTSTQGIIGANIYDYDGDSYVECLVIRQSQSDYIIDCYDYNLNLLDSYTACSFTPGRPGNYITLKISMLNDCIVIENSSMSVPSLSNYGTNVAILSLSDGKFDEIIAFGGFRHTMQGESLYLNDESIGDTTLTENDTKTMKNKISFALQSLGILFNSLEVGRINDSFGVEIKFTNEPVMLFEDAYIDGLTYFKDYTNLRDYISTQSNTLTNYEEIYYSYIENELIPQYGLSDLAGFEAVNWNVSPVVNEIPSCTQGIIGAKIYDYNEDGYKECLIIRQEKTDYIVECYDHNLELLDTHIACSFRPGNPGYNVLLNVSMLENYILIESSSSSFPNLSRSGTNITLLRLFDGKLNETITFGGNRATMQYEELYLNDETIQDTMLTEDDVESMENKIGSALQSLGISFDNLEVGWINLSYAYGVEIEFTDEPILLFENVNSDGVTYFNDYTNLREHITAQAQSENLCDSEQSTVWQQLYADELRKYMNSDNYSAEAMFDLYDFDNNGIVELIVSSGEAHLCTCSVFGIKDGAMTLLCENIGENGSLSVYEGGIVCGTFTPSGPGQTMKNTKFIKISSVNSELLYELTADGFPPDYDRYTINGTESTAEEYDNIINQYITQEPLQYSIGRKYPLDEATINSILLSSSTRIGTIITENDALNVRQSPSTESNKIGTVGKGSTVIIRSEVDGWYEIEFNSNSGYVSGEYVQIVE
ncbi:MAG: SH3 domain-containing protein [Ruminococcus sp.]|nr:SH3 domain-containing protein [Ruminococcus sp.]